MVLRGSTRKECNTISVFLLALILFVPVEFFGGRFREFGRGRLRMNSVVQIATQKVDLVHLVSWCCSSCCWWSIT